MTTTTLTTTATAAWCRDCGEDADAATLDLDDICPDCRSALDESYDPSWDAFDAAWGARGETR